MPPLLSGVYIWTRGTPGVNPAARIAAALAFSISTQSSQVITVARP